MKKMDNKGMTLVEMLVSFIILGILLVVAAKVIHSCTEVYYNNRSVSYGIQAAQIVATEIRGEIEDALPLNVYDIDNTSSRGYYIIISDSNHMIEFVGKNGIQKKIYLKQEGTKSVLYEESWQVYDSDTLDAVTGSISAFPVKQIDSSYIGMGYEVKDITFEIFYRNTEESTTPDLQISDCPVLKMHLKVCNNQFDIYECDEYIALYGLYGLQGKYGIDNILNKIQVN